MSRPALHSLPPQHRSPTALAAILGIGLFGLSGCTGEASATTDIPPTSDSSEDYECVIGGLGCACSEVSDCEPGLSCMDGICGGMAKPPTSAGLTSDGTEGTGTTATSTDASTTDPTTTGTTTSTTGTTTGTTDDSTSTTTDGSTTDGSTTDGSTTAATTTGTGTTD